MARTKQMARKTDKDGTLPKTTVTTTGNNRSAPTPSLQSPGGQNLATFPRRSARLLESDSELEQAAAMFGVGSPARSTQSKTPSRASSPARSSPRRGTLGRGASPARGSPAHGTSGHGQCPAQGSPKGVTPGRGIPVGTPKPRPVGMVNPQVKPGTSTEGVTPASRPGQAGFINRGGEGAARSSTARGYNLPSLSSGDNDEDEEEDMEVDFPNSSQ